MGALGAYALVLLLAAFTTAQSPLQNLEDLPTVPSASSTTIPIAVTNPKNGDNHDAILASKKQDVNSTVMTEENLQNINGKSAQTLLPTDQPEAATTEQPLQTTVMPSESEALPTPLPVQISREHTGGEQEDVDNRLEEQDDKKKSSVPKKGVVYEPPSPVPKEDDVPKPSVVPKKEADQETFKPSVVPKKGADPEILKPSVVPKKGADPATLKPSVVPKKGADPKSIKPSVVPKKGADPGQLLPQISEANMNIQIPTTTVSTTINSPLDNGSKSKSSSIAAVNNLLPSPVKKPTPSLISPIKLSENNFTPTSFTPTIPMAAQNKSSNSTRPELELTTEMPATVHSKPTAAIDSLDGVKDKEDGSGAYTPAAIGIVLLLCILITVMVLGFRRLQDVWMRRHYARMDFLIDGMYDM